MDHDRAWRPWWGTPTWHISTTRSRSGRTRGSSWRGRREADRPDGGGDHGPGGSDDRAGRAPVRRRARSNIFHDDIAWLADADVTRGCNPPANTEFCPSDEVTREQMAAFMRRLAENRVDAGRLQGLTVDQLAAEFGGGSSSQPALSYV